MEQDQVQIEAQLQAAREKAMPEILRAKEEKASGGELLLIETDIAGAEVLAFRIPSPAEWKMYRIGIGSQEPAAKVAAINGLVQVCCVYPTPDNFKRIVEAHPGIVETCYGDLQEHAGAARAKKVSKL